MKYRAIAYIHPQLSEFPSSIKLEENVKIRKLRKTDKKLKIENGLRSMRSFDFTSMTHCIEILDIDILGKYVKKTGEFDYELSHTELVQNIQEQFDKIILPLRLFKKGVIGYNEFDIYNQESNGYLGTVSRVTAFWGEKYQMKAYEKKMFINFYNILRNLSKINFLNLAINRFETSYERSDKQDRLIDLFIALESLFSKNSQGELSYGLSLGVSSYLSDSKLKRTEIFKKIKNAYSLRCRLVHGNSVSDAELEKNIEITEEYLRGIITRVLVGKQGKSHADFQRDVEEKMPFSK